MNIFEHKTLVKNVALSVADRAFRSTKTYSRPVFIAWGPAGSGKTKNTTIAGTEIHFPVLNIRLGQELAEDMSFPSTQNGVLKKILAEMWLRYKVDANGNKIPRRRINEDGERVEIEGEYQIGFSDIPHYIENYEEVSAYYEEQGLTIDDAPGGIVFLDEINRIEDKQMFQMIFQLFESGTFKGHTIPEELTLMGACNPPNGYIVANWFDDPAFSNRCVHYQLLPDKDISLEIARLAGYGDVALELVTTYPDLLFNKEENNFKLPEQTLSLRNLSFFETYVMNIDWAKTEHPHMVNHLVTAVYGPESLARFHSVLEATARQAIEPLDILTKYDSYDMGEEPYVKVMKGDEEDYEPKTVYANLLEKDISKATSKQRKILLQAAKDNKSDFLYRVGTNFTEYVVENIDEPEFQELFAKNKMRFLQFALDLPRDTYATMMSVFVTGDAFQGKQKTFIDVIGMDEQDDASRALVDCILHLDELVEDKVLND